MAQKRSTKTRAKVLEAATELILAHGHESVSLKDISDLSGVSNGSIFHHFGSKEGIIRALFVRERQSYLGTVADAILDFTGDPCDAIGEGARAAMRYHAAFPQEYDRLVAEFSESEWLRRNEDVWLEAASAIEQPVIEWAMPHFANGALPIMAPAAFQAMMLGPAEVATRSFRQGRFPGDLETQIEAVGEFVSLGMRALRDKADKADKG